MAIREIPMTPKERVNQLDWEDNDICMRLREIEFEQLRRSLRVLNEPLYQKLEAHRNLMETQGSAR
jgi:hypothetical protein